MSSTPSTSSTSSGSGPSSGDLGRRLGLADAVVIGLAAMLGAGAFVSLGAAQDIAGPAALVAILIAAAVAAANATSTAQLAAQYPTSGGTYFYGREQLGEWPGFLAGWCFVIGKTASCAAMALVVAAYLVPEAWERPVAALVVVVMTAVNCIGVTRTAGLARILLAVALAALLATAVRLGLGVLGVTGTAGDGAGTAVGDGFAAPWGGPLAILQAAALLFFAFAGYARVATLGEEVTDPRRTIPRAIVSALAIIVVLYLILGVLLVLVAPAEVAADGWGPAPFLAALGAVGAGPVWSVVISIGAVAAASGALLALIAGVSRTMLGMAREGDLPRGLSRINPRFEVPQRAEITVGIAVVALVLLAGDALLAIAASSFGVLLYYAVANAAALTQDGNWRLYPKALQVFGLIGCVALVASLPWTALFGGLAVVAIGVIARAVAQRRSPAR
ncbi:MAG: APC family permease [Brachybacterium sp.]|nr:APC family permease [Brachybacterium sp.]